MIFVPTFLRIFDPVYGLRQFSLTVFLLPSILCFFASSYTIDDTCKDYKGNDITGDIEQAIVEVREMAHEAFVATLEEVPRVNNLLNTLFGTERSKQDVVVEYFWKLSRNLGPNLDFVVICDDQEIHLEEDKVHHPPNPLGIWFDRRHDWHTAFESFVPCSPTNYAFTVDRHLIYLCPHILDLPIGRSIASYKDTDNMGHYIEDFLSLPLVLFHELLHTRSFQRKPSSRRLHHILIL